MTRGAGRLPAVDFAAGPRELVRERVERRLLELQLTDELRCRRLFARQARRPKCLGYSETMVSEALALWSVRRVLRMAPGAVRDLQARKLRDAVRYAYERVPFYRQKFDGAGVHPAEIHSIADLARLPQTTKQDLQTQSVGRIVAVDPETCSTRHTNGSTGRPLRIYLTRSDRQARSLVELRSMVALGLRVRDHAVCVGPETHRGRRLHERLGIYANSFVVGTLPPEEQLRRLRELRPTVLWFYPTVLRALLRAADYRLRDYVRPRMLITSAEMFDDLLRRQIREDLGIEPYSAYGTNEIGRIAMECPAREGLHINVDHVVLEAWADGRAAKPGEAGAALVTTLNTRGMPLVRYNLGDQVRLLEKPCSCGSPLPLMELPGGRENDVLALPSGRTVSLWGVTFVLREYLDIMQFRIVQERLDYVRIEVVPREPLSQDRLREIQKRALARVDEPITIEVREVGELAGESLKFRYFITHVAPPAGAPVQ